MKPRNLHVSELWQNEKNVPYMRLGGQWLKDAGFNSGDGINVYVEHGQLLIVNRHRTIDGAVNLASNGGSLESIVNESMPAANSESHFGRDYRGYTVNLKLERDYSYKPMTIYGPADVYRFLAPLKDESREVMLSINVDAQNTVVGVYDASKGGTNSAPVSIPEVFKSGLIQNASGIILAHNHPSGSPNPSSSDLSLTKTLVDASKVVGINILDHIIIGYMGYHSMKDQGQI